MAILTCKLLDEEKKHLEAPMYSLKDDDGEVILFDEGVGEDGFLRAFHKGRTYTVDLNRYNQVNG